MIGRPFGFPASLATVIAALLFIDWLIYLWLKPDPDRSKPDDPTA